MRMTAWRILAIAPVIVNLQCQAKLPARQQPQKACWSEVDSFWAMIFKHRFEEISDFAQGSTNIPLITGLPLVKRAAALEIPEVHGDLHPGTF